MPSTIYRTSVIRSLLTCHHKSGYVSALIHILLFVLVFERSLFALVEVTFSNCADQTNVVTIFTDSSFIPPLIYAAMGSSRHIAIGPVAVVSLLLGTLLQNETDLNTHQLEYRRLAFTATFFAGVTQAALTWTYVDIQALMLPTGQAGGRSRRGS